MSSIVAPQPSMPLTIFEDRLDLLGRISKLSLVINDIVAAMPACDFFGGDLFPLRNNLRGGPSKIKQEHGKFENEKTASDRGVELSQLRRLRRMTLSVFPRHS